MMKHLTPCLTDDQFIRGSVPMTKEEVRHLAVCKLHLSPDSVVYDIGCGTGSVAVEIACLSPDITVYGIETKEEALEIIRQNRDKFGCTNLQPVHALAPAGLENLPVPTHAFIGGTKGNLRPILDCLRAKNPAMRVVMTAVSLESIAEITGLLKEFPVNHTDVVQVGVSRIAALGDYHLLQAQNPVFIFSFDFGGSDE